ncbi:MAG: hypothetical protein R2867_31960 [Caldilineaceae bacterium]
MLITNEKQQINQDAVQAALDQFHRALNALFAGNISPMMTVWSHADDVTYMGPNGAYRVGWQEVLADWAAQAALRLGGSVEAEDVRIVTGPKLAVVHNRATVPMLIPLATLCLFPTCNRDSPPGSRQLEGNWCSHRSVAHAK